MAQKYPQSICDSKELDDLYNVVKEYVYQSYTFEHEQNIIRRRGGTEFGEPDDHILQWKIKESGYYQATLAIEISVNPTEDITVQLYDEPNGNKILCMCTVKTPHLLMPHQQEEVFQAAIRFLDHKNDYLSPHTAEPDTSKQHVVFENSITEIFQEPMIASIPHDPSLNISIFRFVEEYRSGYTRYIVSFKVDKHDTVETVRSSSQRYDWLISGTIKIDDHPSHYQFTPLTINGKDCEDDGHNFRVRKLEHIPVVDIIQLVNGYVTEWNGWFDLTYKQSLKYVGYLKHLSTIPRSNNELCSTD